MKPYFSKQLTEAARSGHSDKSKKWGGKVKYILSSEYENQPATHISMSRHRGTKSLSDVLGPLKSFLHHRIGRNWDDVYSELNQRLDRRTVSGLHVFTHLWQFVKKDCALNEKGQVCIHSSYFGLLPLEKSYIREQWYVHPVTNVLCYFSKKREKKVYPVTEIKIADGEKYAIEDGIWYYFRFWKEEYLQVEDEKGKIHRYYKDKVEKLQLNRKELKALKLKNLAL